MCQPQGKGPVHSNGPPELNLSNVICGFPLFPDFYLEIDLEVKA
jgi:hypothetical protein